MKDNQNDTQNHEIRIFDSGATRDSDDGKLDYEGFLSVHVLCRYAKYMHDHRTQSDGKLRASDNWQKGIPLTAYMKSMWRHFIDVWSVHREFVCRESIDSNALLDFLEESLCALMFNVMGFLHEILKKRRGGKNDD